MNKALKLIPLRKDYNSLIDSVGVLLEEARKKAYSQINQLLVKTYWEIGKRIVEFEQQGEKKAEYGSNLLDKLSEDLTKSYGSGFSAYNLRKMRLFYLTFQKWATVSPKLSWSHYRLILRLNNPLAREFYIKESESDRIGQSPIDELRQNKNTRIAENCFG
ncbi:MAG: DUF1016 N-terminal domain-containing protein [Nanoarchaeota archaeon]